MRSTTCSASLCGWPAVSSQLLSVKPAVSTTSVAPSQWPIECPIQEGSRSSGWPRPSIQICRIALPVSKSINTRFLLCKISNGPTWFIRRGMPYGAQLVRYGSILSSLARPSGPVPQPTSSHRLVAHGCIGGGASGEKLYGKKPLGVLGGDQIPVRSGAEAAACGCAARSSGARRGSSPSDNTSTAEVLRTGIGASFFIRMTLSLLVSRTAPGKSCFVASPVHPRRRCRRLNQNEERSVPGRIDGDDLTAGHGDLHRPQTFHPVDYGNALFFRVPVNRDLVPSLECAVIPSDAAAHNIRRVKFHGPGFHVALVVFHVDEQQGVGILPIEFLDRSGDGPPRIDVPSRGAVMRENGR